MELVLDCGKKEKKIRLCVVRLRGKIEGRKVTCLELKLGKGVESIIKCLSKRGKGKALIVAVLVFCLFMI